MRIARRRGSFCTPSQMQIVFQLWPVVLSEGRAGLRKSCRHQSHGRYSRDPSRTTAGIQFPARRTARHSHPLSRNLRANFNREDLARRRANKARGSLGPSKEVKAEK